MKLIEGKKTGLNILSKNVRKTPSRLWSVGKSTSRHLNTLNTKEDIEQDNKKKQRKNKLDPTRFMTPSEIKKWNKLPERKKEQLLRKERLAEERKMNVSYYGGRRYDNNEKSRFPSSNWNRTRDINLQGRTEIAKSGSISIQEGTVSAKTEGMSRQKRVSVVKSGSLGQSECTVNVKSGSTKYNSAKKYPIKNGSKGGITTGSQINAAKSGVKVAASTGATAATATSAVATGGVTLAAAAGKKTAEKFRKKINEDFQKQAESIRQTELDKSRKEQAQQTEDKQYSFSTSNVFGSKTFEKVIKSITAAAVSILGAIMSLLSYVFMIVAVLVIIFIIILTLFSKTGGTGRQRMVEAALAEYAVADQNIGGVKYKNWYGLDADWCGMFVSYCANECGFISEGIIPKSASVSENMKWYQAREEFETKESGYIPMPGDIIFFTNGKSHMGIVIEYDEDSDHVVVVEGNSGSSDTTPYHKGSRVKKASYARTAAAISGYGTPAYPDQVSDLIGESNAEKIYRALVEQGYSEQAAAAVVGNLYREAGIDASGDINIHAENPSGSSIGIAQWTGGRKKAFLSFADAEGEPWPDTSLRVQLNYLLYELSSNQWMWSSISKEYGDECNMSLAEFKTLTDTEFATRVFCAMFERCHLSNAGLPYRIQKAQETYQKFSGT